MMLMKQMCQAQLQPDVRTFNSTLSCCKMEEKWREAVDLLFDMKKLKVMPNVVSYNTSMSCCEGEWQVALALFQSMFAESLQPDVITYSTAINSTVTSGNWQMAMLLFAMINKQRLQSDVICFGAAISSCVKSGQWQHALVLVEASLSWLICKSFLRENGSKRKAPLSSQSKTTVERFDNMFQQQELSCQPVGLLVIFFIIFQVGSNECSFFNLPKTFLYQGATANNWLFTAPHNDQHRSQRRYQRMFHSR